MTTMEEWLPIPGFEDRYEVSNHGRVKSLARTIRLGIGHLVTKTKGESMLQGYLRNGSRGVTLYKPDQRPRQLTLARLVHEVHLGSIPEGFIVKLLDNDPHNCHISNMVLWTRAQLLDVVGRRRKLVPEIVA